MASKWEKYTRQQLQEMVANSRSYRDLAGKIGYKPDGGSGIKATKEMIAHYNFNVDHFLGQGWNKNNFDYSRFQDGKVIKIAEARGTSNDTKKFVDEVASWVNDTK